MRKLQRNINLGLAVCGLILSTSLFAGGLSVNMPGYTISSSGTVDKSGVNTFESAFINNMGGPKNGTVSFTRPPVAPTRTSPAKQAEQDGLQWNEGAIPQVAFNWGQGVEGEAVVLTVSNDKTGFHQSVTCPAEQKQCVITVNDKKDWTMDLEIDVRTA